MIRRHSTPTKLKKHKLAKYSQVDSRFKTMREFLFQDELGHWIFPNKKKGFYYCHVLLDQLDIKQTPPDLYSMTAETGYNLVGISVAMDTYTRMLMSGQWDYLMPYFYYTWYCPDKYKKSQKIIFEGLSNLTELIMEDMYNAGYQISIAGGGLGVYIPMIVEWLSQVSIAQVQALNVLNKLNRSKEFYFVEYNLADPTYGKLMFNNLTYAVRNANQFTFKGTFGNDFNSSKGCWEEKMTSFEDDPTIVFGANWNIFNPQRQETWVKKYITKIYDSTVSYETMYKECDIARKDTVLDSFKVAQTDNTVNGASYSFSMSNKRELSNLIVQYTNRPLNDTTSAPVTKFYVFKGDAQIEQFFRAGSWFYVQPLITNFLYSTYLVETGKDKTLGKQLQPPRIRTKDEWQKFTQHCKDTMSYGDPMRSVLSAWMKTQIKNIGGSGGLNSNFSSGSKK